MAYPSKTPQRPPVLQLADQLEQRLEALELQPGDRFFTAREAAKELKVRQELANRALQILVHRGRLERKQRIGAVVAQASAAAPELGCIHILIQEDHQRAEAEAASAVQVGLLSQWPGSEVVIQVVPTGGASEYVNGVLRRAARAKKPEGMVLERCDYTTQRQVADGGLPAVIHGSAYPGIPLASVNVDERQMGDLQAETLITQGVRKIVVLRKDRSVPGDLEFLRGLRARMACAGFAADSIDLIDLPPDEELVGAALVPTFDEIQSGETRIGIVCATSAFADAAWEAGSAFGLRPGDDFLLQANRSLGRPHTRLPYPCLRALVRPEERGVLLGELLRDALERRNVHDRHRLVPCELVTPDSACSD